MIKNKMIQLELNNMSEKMKKAFFDKEKIKGIYSKYFENKVGFFKKMYASVYRTDDNRNYFEYSTGEYFKDIPTLEDHDIYFMSSFYKKYFSYVCEDETSDYLLLIQYGLDDFRNLTARDEINIKKVIIFNKEKFFMELSKDDVKILENSKIKKTINEISPKNSELNKMIDYYGRYVLGQGAKPMIITGHGKFIDFLCHKEVFRKDSKKQKIIDSIKDENLKLINFKPEEINYDHLRNFKIYPSTYVASKRIFVFAKGDVQLTEDGWLVIRGFYEYNEKDKEPVIIEAIRFYYKDGKFVKARKCIDNTFITAQGILPEHCIFNIDVENISDEAFEKTNLKYYKEIIKNIGSTNTMLFLYQLFNNPDIEKLYKLGFVGLVKEVALTTVESDIMIKEYLGSPVSSSKNILNKYGINSYQAQKVINYLNENDINSNSEERAKIIKYLRYIKNDLSDIDNNSFDRMLKIVTYKEPSSAFLGFYIWNIFKYFVERKELQTAINRMEQFISAYEENSEGYSLYQICSIYNDMLRMSNSLTNFFNDDVFKIKSINELLENHNNMVYLLNKYQKEIYKASFEEKQKKWKKYFFEDENYLITAPKESDDLAREGMELHHCVKSYIDAVSEGSTNILFLRKKETPDKPFFTIELTNNDQIRQIHGFANCDITVDKDAHKFYLKWLKEKNLKNYTSNGALAVGRI